MDYVHTLFGYNKHTLQQMTVNQSSDIPIIDCSSDTIKERAKKWIKRIRNIDESDETTIVSAMVDATKVPPIGEYTHKYTS